MQRKRPAGKLPSGPVRSMFSVQDLTHHDSADDVAAGPSEGKRGDFLRHGGFPSRLTDRFHAAQLFIMAGVIAFAHYRPQTAGENRVVMVGFIQRGGPGGQPFRLSLLRRILLRRGGTILRGHRFRRGRPGRLFLIRSFLRDRKRNPDDDPV